MREKKYYLRLTADERRLIVECLIEMRNRLIREGKYADLVEEVMCKLVK